MTTVKADSYELLAGCAGVSHPDAAMYDRRWLIVDEQGQWISEAGALQSIQVDLRFGHMVLQAPGMLRLDIPLDVIEDDDSVRRIVHVGQQPVDVVDEGEVAATWVTQCLGRGSRLMKVHPDAAPIQWPSSS